MSCTTFLHLFASPPLRHSVTRATFADHDLQLMCLARRRAGQRRPIPNIQCDMGAERGPATTVSGREPVRLDDR